MKPLKKLRLLVVGWYREFHSYIDGLLFVLGGEKMNKSNFLKYFSHKELEEIKATNDVYLKAQSLVIVLFEDKVDKAGEPYIGHLYRVSDKLNEPIERVAALLHDTIEDTEITAEDLIEIGFPGEIIEIVKLVTKKKIDRTNMTKEEKLILYNEEIDGIINSGNIHAIRLKEADMSDNYNPERLKKLSADKQAWFDEKYGKQLTKLRNVKGIKKL